MKKMRAGILISKSRRAVWERNQSLSVPPDPQPDNPHKPQPGPYSTVWCCSNRYTPAAHPLHIKGDPLPMSCSGVVVAGSNDPWLAEQDARLKAERAGAMPDDAARIRAEQIDLYYEQQQRLRRVARVVDGAGSSMTE